MPPYQVGIASYDCNRIAQLLAGYAKGATPKIQAFDVADIDPGPEIASVYVCCGLVHVLLPFVSWVDAHSEVSICSRNRVFHPAHNDVS